MQTKPRPKYLNLFMLAPKMSVTAKVSILHRASGMLLFLAIPFILFILHSSLVEASSYAAFYGVISNPIMKLLYLLLIWAFTYHACAGIRFLFLDLHKGTRIRCAKTTARVVLIISSILTIALGVLIW